MQLTSIVSAQSRRGRLWPVQLPEFIGKRFIPPRQNNVTSATNLNSGQASKGGRLSRANVSRWP